MTSRGGGESEFRGGEGLGGRSCPLSKTAGIFTCKLYLSGVFKHLVSQCSFERSPKALSNSLMPYCFSNHWNIL